MNLPPLQRIANAPAVIQNLALEIFRDLAPKVLFFFAAFGLLFLLFKLFVAQYSIAYSVFARAAVAALILGKVISLLDWADSGYRFSGYRRATVIALKTVVYALAVIVIGIGDRILKAARAQGSLQAGVQQLIANANIDRFLGLTLLISLVISVYLTIQEIDRALGGNGSLLRLLWDRPSEGAK